MEHFILYRVLVIIVLLDFHFILLLLSKGWSICGTLEKSDYHLIFSTCFLLPSATSHLFILLGMLVGLCCSLMFKLLYTDASDVTFVRCYFFLLQYQTNIFN